MDTLRINGLRFYGYHGEMEVEKEGGQVFEVDVEIRFDQRPSSADDDLSKGVDVREVYRRIRQVVQGPSRDLVETVAQDLADSLLEIPPVESTLIRLKKPAAYRYDAEEPGYEVEIERFAADREQSVMNNERSAANRERSAANREQSAENREQSAAEAGQE
ncbi:dihydroneopterin aldolase [Gemmatimonadota bacterium]